MPPKGSRGGRTGRGRGRGRGASERPPTPSTQDASGSLPVNENASTTLTAGDSQDASSQNTPTLSPASIPTETPAPTPATIASRTPTQRPDSLAPGRGRGRGRGAPVAGNGPPSFKPKAVRRDQSERQKAADEERKRVEERNRAAEMAEARVSVRGRGALRGARGRGDVMGKREPPRPTAATGLFSQLPAHMKKDNKRIGDPAYVVGPSGYEGFNSGSAGSITKLAGRPKGKPGSTTEDTVEAGHTRGAGGTSGARGSSDGVKIKKEVPDPEYPGMASGAQRSGRVNIEHINVVSDDENGEVPSHKGKGRATDMRGSGGLKPIRVLREEHQDRITVVNTEASGGPANIKEGDMAVDDDGGLFVPQDLEAERNRRNKAGVVSRDATGKPWAGVWNDPDDDLVQIKPDPDASEAMDIDNIPISVPPRSPSEVHEPVIKEGPSPRAKPRIRRGSGLRDKHPVLQTDEDRAEWARHQEDVAILAQELGGLQTAKTPRTGGINDANGDTEMGQEQPPQVMDKEGRLYLFQFPPIMPPLRNANHIKKEEPAEEDIDMTQISSKPASGIAGSATAPINVSKSAKTDEVLARGIKTEPDTEPPKNTPQTAEELIPEEGFIGKLIVRESGAVELDWGGTDFVLSRGASHDFLITTLLMDGLAVEDDPEEDAGTRHVAAAGLGSVMGKFVVTPDWDKIF